VDEKGLSLAGESALASSQFPLRVNLQIPLTWRTGMGKKLARLRATVTGFIITKREVWEVPDVLNAKDASKTVRGPEGEETYTLLGVQKTGSLYQVRIKVTREPLLVPPEIAPEGRLILYMRRELSRLARLMDAEGRFYRASGAGGSQSVYILTFHAIPGEGEKPGEPQKLVLDIPTEFRQLEIPIDLKDIPLP
jgi:hypothetical protein